MARANIGGTRSLLRGRVGSDVYSVSESFQGKKVQIVKSAPTTYNNRQTTSQQIARMNMALCMSAIAQLKEITDHSFETIGYGQRSIDYFVQKNIKLIQEDCKAHFWGDSDWEYPEKGITKLLSGKWIISEGSLIFPSSLSEIAPATYETYNQFRIYTRKNNPTFLDLKNTLGAAAGDYLTLWAIVYSNFYDIYGSNTLCLCRYFLAEDMADTTVLTSSNIHSAFSYETNCEEQVSINTTTGVITLTYKPPFKTTTSHGTMCHGAILSKRERDIWKRSNCQAKLVPDARDVFGIGGYPAEVFETWCPSWNGSSDPF